VSHPKANYLTSQSNQAISAGNGSFTFQTLTFADSNGVSFSTGTQGIFATVKTDYLTSQSNQAFSASGSSSTFQTLQFGNSNGVSFSISNGSIVATVATNYQSQGAYLTTAMASNAGSNFVGLNSAITANGVSASINSSGISLNFPAFLTTAMQSAQSSNFAKTGFTSSTVTGTNILATNDTNGLSMLVPAFVTNAAGGGITNVNISAGTTSQNLSNFVFSNSNNVSFGINGSTITASINAGAGGGIALANSQTTYTSGTANIIASGALTIGSTTGQSFYFSAPAQSSLSATGNISISVNGSTISIGDIKQTRASLFVPWEEDYVPSKQFSSGSLGQNSIYLYGAYFPDYVSGSILKIPMFITNSSSAVSSGQKGQTIRFGIYTTNATNSTVLGLWQSSSYTIGASYSSNASWMLSLITGVGNTTSYNTLTASSAGLNLSASLHGNRDILIPVTATFTAGSYWFAFHHSTSGAGTVGNVLNISQAIYSWNTFNRIGASTNATGSGLLKDFGIGTYSATSAAFPSGISMTQINQLGVAPIFYIGNKTV
jgi:hypothetical protein